MTNWGNAKYDQNTKFTTPLPDEKFLLSLDKGIKILDIGCGYGRTLQFLHDLGFKDLTGFDISSDYIKHAKKICPSANLFVSSFEDFELEEKYDLILMMGVIEYILSDQKQDIFFEKIAKFLSSRGYILLETFVLDFKSGWRQYLKGLINTMHFGCFKNSKGFECHHQIASTLRKILKKHFIIEVDIKKEYTTWNNGIYRGHYFILRPKNINK